MSKAGTSRWALAVCFVLAGAFTCSIASADFFTGTMSVNSPSNALDGTGALWAHDTSIQWSVDDNTPGLWHYNYVFQVLNTTDDNIKYLILETSPTFTSQNLLNLTWYGSYTIGTYNVGSTYPEMPDSIYGIRFSGDSNRSTTWVIDFYSTRSPVWGDFYARSPSISGEINTVTNKGFKYPDTDPNVSVYPLTNGPVFDHLLVPDTQDGNNPVGRTGTIRVFKFNDPLMNGSEYMDPNYRLEGWTMNITGDGNFAQVTGSDGGTFFNPLNGASPWSVAEAYQNGWTFTGARVYDSNGVLVNTFTDGNTILVDISQMDMDVYIGNVYGVPEPATLAIAGVGCAWLASRIRRRRNARNI